MGEVNEERLGGKWSKMGVMEEIGRGKGRQARVLRRESEAGKCLARVQSKGERICDGIMRGRKVPFGSSAKRDQGRNAPCEGTV